MNIPDIQKLADKSSIDRVEATVKKVFPPKQPTPAQEKAGINVQTLLLADGGSEIYARILRANKHIGRDAEGKTYVFQSTKNDNGKPDGIAAGVYKDKVTVDMNGHVQIWQVLSEAGTEPAKELDTTRTEPAKELDTTRTEPAREPDTTRTEPVEQPCGSLQWIENYMKFYRSAYDVVARAMAGTGVTADAAKEILTGKLIEESRKGKLDDKIAAFLKSPEARPEPDWREVTTKDGRVIAEMGHDELAEFATTALPHITSKDKRIQTVCDAVILAIAQAEIYYAEIYDRWDVRLAETYDIDAIAHAYKKIEASMGGDREATCFKIMQNPDVYIKLIESHMP